MQEKNLSSDYAEYYEKAAIFPQQLDARELELFASLAPKAPSDILDLGCAEGRLAVRLAKDGHRVSVGDVAPSQLRFAEALAGKSGVALQGSFLCNIEEGLEPFGGRRFDAIFFMDVVEHLKNPVQGLVNLRGLLKEDGVLVLNTPNACTPYRFLWHAYRRGPASIDYHDPEKLGDFHFQTYDYLTLEKTLNFVGLKIAEQTATRVTIPRLFSSRLLARIFPLLSDTLLLKCRKAPPIDLDAQIEHWKRTLPVDNSLS